MRVATAGDRLVVFVAGRPHACEWCTGFAFAGRLAAGGVDEADAARFLAAPGALWRAEALWAGPGVFELHGPGLRDELPAGRCAARLRIQRPGGTASLLVTVGLRPWPAAHQPA